MGEDPSSRPQGGIFMKRLAVLTSGGDAPGMNAAVRAVVRTALALGCQIYGIYRGYAGLLDDDFVRMESSSVSGVVLHGGTMLKTARCKEFLEEENQIKAAAPTTALPSSKSWDALQETSP